MWDDTAFIVTTDHGHDLRERGGYGKQSPHFDSHANIPLMVWHPHLKCHEGRIEALTSTVDIFASVLEMGGVTRPARSHLRSFVPLLGGDTSSARDAVIYGTFGQGDLLRRRPPSLPLPRRPIRWLAWNARSATLLWHRSAQRLRATRPRPRKLAIQPPSRSPRRRTTSSRWRCCFPSKAAGYRSCPNGHDRSFGRCGPGVHRPRSAAWIGGSVGTTHLTRDDDIYVARCLVAAQFAAISRTNVSL